MSQIYTYISSVAIGHGAASRGADRDRSRIPMPEADQAVFEPVLFGAGAPYERTFHYDADLRLRINLT